MDDSLTTSSDIAGIAFVLGILPSSVKRLPLLAYHVAKEMYENQEKSTSPYFDSNIRDQLICQISDEPPLGIMAYLVQIIAIWDDVSAYMYRSEQWSRETYIADYGNLHRSIYARFASWHSNLTTCFLSNPVNIAESLKGGDVGTFISMHSLYHTSLMMLNRRIRHAELPRDGITRNIHEAVSHAQRLLSLMEELSRVIRHSRAKLTATPHSHRTKNENLESIFFHAFPGICYLDGH